MVNYQKAILKDFFDIVILCTISVIRQLDEGVLSLKVLYMLPDCLQRRYQSPYIDLYLKNPL